MKGGLVHEKTDLFGVVVDPGTPGELQPVFGVLVCLVSARSPGKAIKIF